MEITYKFTDADFEVWVDHIQYLDLGEKHQSVPSGKSFIRGKFDSDQDAYVIDKIHIDPDMIQTDIKDKLLYEAKLQAHKRDKRMLKKNRVAAMPDNKMKPSLYRNQQSNDRPMITRDLQTAVWRLADSLARSLKDPQGSTPGDARWTVSGLSHSSWSISHPDIIREGDSPLTLRIKKLPDGRWVAFGQNRLTNLLNTKTLAVKKTPPGGDDWDDIENFAKTAAAYFQEQKASILELKQSMTPEKPPGAGYGAQPQQQGGGTGGEMGGMGGGMMASRRSHRRESAEFNITPEQAMNVLQIKGTGDLDKDRANLREIMKKSHPDVASGPFASMRMTAINVLMETFIRQNKPLPTEASQVRQEGQGVGVGGQATEGTVNQKVQEYISQAVNGAGRLQQSLSVPKAQVSQRAVIMNVNKLNEFVHGAAITVQANLGTKDTRSKTLYEKLIRSSQFLGATLKVLTKAGPDINKRILAEVIKNLSRFIQAGNDALRLTTKQANRRASATLDNLRKAQKIAHQIDRVCGNQAWYLGVRVVNDRDGVGLGVGAREVPPRSLRSSLGGIPLILEGPGARMAQTQREARRRFRLARRLAQEVADEMGVDPKIEKELKNHQRLVKKVYNYIKNSKRLSGSVRYLARKLGINFNDLVRVIGQLIVEGKIEITKKKKFRLLPEPHTPIPGMKERFSATNSVFGIDRGQSDKRVDQLLSHSNFQMNLDEPEPLEGVHDQRDLRERPSRIMPDPTVPN